MIGIGTILFLSLLWGGILLHVFGQTAQISMNMTSDSNIKNTYHIIYSVFYYAFFFIVIAIIAWIIRESIRHQEVEYGA